MYYRTRLGQGGGWGRSSILDNGALSCSTLAYASEKLPPTWNHTGKISLFLSCNDILEKVSLLSAAWIKWVRTRHSQLMKLSPLVTDSCRSLCWYINIQDWNHGKQMGQTIVFGPWAAPASLQSVTNPTWTTIGLSPGPSVRCQQLPAQDMPWPCNLII